MATIQEKITQQAHNPSKVFLFKEGIFYKAYNQGAFLLRNKNYKVAIKKVKNIENNVASIGFPIAVFEALKKDFAIQDFESYSCFDAKVVFNEAEFQNWYNTILSSEQNETKAVKQQKNGLDPSCCNEIIQQIKNYPLANKTPMEVFVWVASLQTKLLPQ